MKASVFVNPRIKTLGQAVRTDAQFMSQVRVRVDEEFRANEKRLFSSEGNSGGPRWAPLSPEYAKRKAGLRRRDLRQSRLQRGLGFRRRITIAGRTILVLGGSMRDSFTQPSSRNHISRVVGRTIELGSSDPLAHYHFAGEGRLPRRDPIQHTDEQKRGYLKTVAAEFVKRIEAVTRSLGRADTARGAA